MASRRRRKRQRLIASSEAGEATAGAAPGLPGLRRSRVRWAEATARKLRILCRAIRHSWPVPDERKRQVISEVWAVLKSGDQERVVTAARAFIAADRR